MSNALGKARSNFDTSNTNYMSTEQAKQNYTQPPATIDSAVSGDQTALTGISSLLGQKNPNAVASYVAPDVAVRDANYLNNDQGLQRLASRGQGSDYGSGSAAFDVNVLRRDPNFQGTVNNLAAQQEALTRAANSANVNNQQTVTDFGVKQLAAGQAKAKTDLQSRYGSIDAAHQQAADAYNQNLGLMRTGKSPTLAAAQKAALANVMANLQKNKVIADYTHLPTISVDPSKYTTISGNLGRDSFMTPGDLAKLNRIDTLLNSGVTRVAAPTTPDAFTINQDRMQNDLQAQADTARKLDLSMKAAAAAQPGVPPAIAGTAAIDPTANVAGMPLEADPTKAQLILDKQTGIYRRESAAEVKQRLADQASYPATIPVARAPGLGQLYY